MQYLILDLVILTLVREWVLTGHAVNANSIMTSKLVHDLNSVNEDAFNTKQRSPGQPEYDTYGTKRILKVIRDHPGEAATQKNSTRENTVPTTAAITITVDLNETIIVPETTTAKSNNTVIPSPITTTQSTNTTSPTILTTQSTHATSPTISTKVSKTLLTPTTTPIKTATVLSPLTTAHTQSSVITTTLGVQPATIPSNVSPIGKSTQTPNPASPLSPGAAVQVASGATSSPSTNATTNSNLASLSSSTINSTSVTAEAITNLPLSYPTAAFYIDNKTCPFGYQLKTSVGACVHLCEDKHCQNDGYCYVELDINKKATAACRCKKTSRVIYKGDNCEDSEFSRSKERAITLGILIPISVISLLVIIIMCAKVKRGSNQLQTMNKSYDVNNL